MPKNRMTKLLPHPKLPPLKTKFPVEKPRMLNVVIKKISVQYFESDDFYNYPYWKKRI